MKAGLFVATAALLATACGSGPTDQPSREFLDTPLAARSTGQESSCYRLRQLLLTRMALGLALEWKRLDANTWELTEMSLTSVQGPKPEARMVYRRTGDLIYLVEAANIHEGELFPLDVAKLTENWRLVFERYSDITPIPDCG